MGQLKENKYKEHVSLVLNTLEKNGYSCTFIANKTNSSIATISRIFASEHVHDPDLFYSLAELAGYDVQVIKKELE
jgi:hypothetical protein